MDDVLSLGMVANMHIIRWGTPALSLSRVDIEIFWCYLKNSVGMFSRGEPDGQ